MKPLSIGLTGGIGSGKSVIASFFRLLGVPVYISDLEAKKMMQTNNFIRNSLVEAFGEVVYSNSGELNRSELAKIIFNDEQALKKVNSIVHPQVHLHYQEWLLYQANAFYVIHESAILFDTGLYTNFDKIITVTADKETRLNRVVQRDSCSVKSVLERMDKQISEQDKIDQSDFVIYNNTELVIPQIINIHNQLLRM